MICFLRSTGRGAITLQQLREQIDNSVLKPFANQIDIVEQEIGSESSTEARGGNRSALLQEVSDYLDLNKLV